MSFREMYLPAGFATLVEFTATQSERSSGSGKGFVTIRVQRGRMVAGTGVTHGCVFGILILYAIVRVQVRIDTRRFRSFEPLFDAR